MKIKRDPSFSEGWFTAAEMMQKYPEQKEFFACFPKYFRFKAKMLNPYTMHIYCMVAWAGFQGIDASLIPDGGEEYVATIIHIKVLKGILDSVTRALGDLVPFGNFSQVPEGDEEDEDGEDDEDDPEQLPPLPPRCGWEA